MRGAVLTACLAVLLAPATASAQATISKSELRSQSPTTTDRVLSQQLWQVFEHEDRRSKHKGTVRLSEVWLSSKPYVQGFEGLCRRDTVVLQFAPADGDAGGRGNANTPTQAYGIDASRSYAFDRRPSKWSWEQNKPTDRTPPGICEAKQWFSATSAETANDGYVAAARAIEAVASGRLKPKSCEAYPNDTKACDSLAGELRVTDIGSIDTCETDDASDCYNVTFGDRGLKIIVERQRIWPAPAGAPAEGAIRSVVFESYVIIADARID